MRKLVFSPTENDKTPTDCSPGLSDFYTQKMNNYKKQIHSLEASNEALKQENESQAEMISNLKSTIVSLTEENIHLRAKMSNFRDFRELCNGIEQTSELIQSQLHKTQNCSSLLAQPSSHNSLVEEIEELKLNLDKKKKKHDSDLCQSQQLYSFYNVNDPKESKPLMQKFRKSREAATAAKRVSTALKKKKKGKQIQYIPSYLKAMRLNNRKF